MSEIFTLQEILSDADAYRSVGDAHTAVEVLLAGLDQFADPMATGRISDALAQLCASFGASGEFARGEEITGMVVKHALQRAGKTVEPEFAAIYSRALVATRSSVFPMRRIYRHRNLWHLFGQISPGSRGDVVECGCAAGLSFIELCLAFSGGRAEWAGEGFHVFDSFEGLSEPCAEDFNLGEAGENAALIAANLVRGNFAVPFDVVRESVHRFFPKAQLHRGWIPDVFAGQPERTYRFVHLDVDLYQPTLDSLNYFMPRLAEGGAIVTDDYNWPGARQAFQEYCALHRLEVHCTDTSQAFVIKGSCPDSLKWR